MRRQTDLLKMTRSERERWLVEFATKSLENVIDLEKNGIQISLWEFSHRKRSSPLPHGGTTTRSTSGGIRDCDWDQVLEAHSRAKQAIEDLLDENKTPTWPIGLSFQVESHGSSPGELLQETRSLVDAFTFEMFQILPAITHRLARCPAPKPIPAKLSRKSTEQIAEPCSSPFLKIKSTKEYCSTTCRLRVTMRQQRKKKTQKEGNTKIAVSYKKRIIK